MRSFYCDPSCTQGEYVQLEPGETHHARNVLRLHAGQTVRVLDGMGTIFLGAWDPDTGRVHIEETLRQPPFSCNVTLAVALLKGDHWDWFLQKAVEIGVSRIVPLLARHNVVRLAEHEPENRRTRWRQIAISALKQSGQAFLPSIETPATVVDFCNLETPHRGVPSGTTKEVRWILSERGGTPLKALLTPAFERITLMVGPEGGWSDQELEISRQRLFQPVSLGSHILRAETVPLYALSVIRFVTG